MPLRFDVPKADSTRHPKVASTSQSAVFWRNLDVVAEIGLWLAEKDLAQFRRVNQTCAKALNSPTQWQFRYRPAVVDWPTHRVRTYIDWREPSTWRGHKAGGRTDADLHLGVFEGRPWSLTADLDPPLPPAGWGDTLLATWKLVPGVPIRELASVSVEHAQQMAFLFFLRRGLRLREGLAVRDYRQKPSQLKVGLGCTGAGLASLEIGILLLLKSDVNHHCAKVALFFAVAGFLLVLVGAGFFRDPTFRSHLAFNDAHQKAIDTVARELLTAVAYLPEPFRGDASSRPQSSSASPGTPNLV